MSCTKRIAALAGSLPLALIALPALAHHPLDGAPMTTFAHGLLSGFGHPILGFDHLFFIVLVGIAALYTGRAVLAPGFFVAGMLAGVGLIMSGINLPLVEPMIAVSLLLLGGIVMAGRSLSLALAALLFAGLGLFHGWAFGQSLTGQEGGVSAAVAAGYLIGLAVTQWAIAVGAGFVLSRIWNATAADALPARLAGGAVAGVGLYLALEAAEGPALVALGLGG